MYKLELYYKRLSTVKRFVLAFAIFVLALAARFKFFPVDNGPPFITFYPALIVVFYLCGAAPGVFIVILSIFTTCYFFIPPHYSFEFTESGAIAEVIFIFTASLLGFLIHRLQFRESLYHDILQDQLELISRFKPDGTLLYVNDAFCRFFGKSRPELAGKQWHPQAHPDDLDTVNQQLRLLTIDNPVITIENRVILADGSIRWGYFVNRGFFDANGRIVEIQSVGRDVTQQKQFEQALQNERNKFQALIHNASDGIHVLNHEGYIIEASDSFCRMLGYSRDEVIGMHVSQWDKGFNSSEEMIAVIRQQFARTERSQFETRHQCKDGRIIDVEVSGLPLMMDGQFVLFNSSRDITERKLYENRLKLSYRVFMHAREAIAITDGEGMVIEVNTTFEIITGYNEKDAQGQVLYLLHSPLHPPEFFSTVWDDLLAKGYWSGEIWAHRENGDRFAAIVTMSSVGDNQGRIQNYVVLFSDITRLKEHQRQLEYAAHFDSLTKLPNRLLLADRLNQAIAQVKRRRCSLAVIFLDLDGFKNVNDQYGHDVGDQLLITVSQRMEEALRDGDTLARMGGDEFVAVAIDLNSIENCEAILMRLLQAASAPVQWQDATFNVSASIGLTFYPQDNVEADQLIRHADQAMYIAKQQGKNRYHLFDITQDQYSKTLTEQIERFEAAFDQDELVLFYQPKVCLKTQKVVGAEALIRWLHPEHGLLKPDQFLPLIDEHPLSIKLDGWVINQALKQLSFWQRQGLKTKVSVNIGALLLQGDQLIQQLAEELKQNPEIEPHCLELEILESRALNNIDYVVKVMHSCQELGVRFALDDFGTGYCSLTYLKHLPADVLKIDQSFVRDMLDDPDDLAIVNGIIGLAQAFGREVIAEGVETKEHGDRLLELGCTFGQGYGLAYPMSGNELHNWIQNSGLDKNNR